MDDYLYTLIGWRPMFLSFFLFFDVCVMGGYPQQQQQQENGIASTCGSLDKTKGAN